MRRNLILIFVVLSIGACATDAESDETTSTTTTSTPAPPNGADPEPEPAETMQADETTTTAGSGEVGTREDPVPVGEIGTVGSYEVVITGYEADATDTVLAENEFNEPPLDAESVYSLITMSITYAGDESGDPWLDLTWSGVGASNVSASSNECTTYPNSIFDAGELFPGGNVESNVCLTVSQSDTDSLLLILEESFSLEESRTFFALP